MSEPWIKWDASAPGADLPVEPDQIVEITLRGSPETFKARAGSIGWSDDGTRALVVLRYRIAGYR